jgi:hypothetical protein
MRITIPILVLATVAMAQTAAQPPSGAAADAKMAIEATLYMTREEAKKALGADPGPNVVVVEVKVTPKTEDGKMYLDHDEFLLRSDRDGQRARPLMPAQLAGTSVMVIGSRGITSSGPVAGGERRVPYGGIPGTPGDPRGGPPPTMPHPQQSQMGSPTAGASEATVSIEEQKAGREQNLLLDALKQKVLPDGEIDKPVSGLLYFSFEGTKHRVKHFELVYRKAPPRIALRFEEPKKK